MSVLGHKIAVFYHAIFGHPHKSTTNALIITVGYSCRCKSTALYSFPGSLSYVDYVTVNAFNSNTHQYQTMYCRYAEVQYTVLRNRHTLLCSCILLVWKYLLKQVPVSLLPFPSVKKAVKHHSIILLHCLGYTQFWVAPHCSRETNCNATHTQAVANAHTDTLHRSVLINAEFLLSEE